MPEARSQDRRRRRDGGRRNDDMGSVTRLLSAMTEGYVELLSESARCAGDFVAEMTEECSRPVRSTLKETSGDRRVDHDIDLDDVDRDRGPRRRGADDWGCDIDLNGLVTRWFDVVDDAFGRFRESFDGPARENGAGRPARARQPRRPEDRAVIRSPQEEQRRRREAELRRELAEGTEPAQGDSRKVVVTTD